MTEAVLKLWLPFFSVELLRDIRHQLIGWSRQPPASMTIEGYSDQVFSTGGDLRWVLENAGNLQALKHYARMCADVVLRNLALPCRTIARVPGVALGGGAEAALTCDEVEARVLKFPEYRQGHWPFAGGEIAFRHHFDAPAEEGLRSESPVVSRRGRPLIHRNSLAAEAMRWAEHLHQMLQDPAAQRRVGRGAEAQRALL